MNDRNRQKRAKGERSAAPAVQGADRAADQASERIAKRLARAGVSSRREAESLIAAGRVRVNGRVLDTPAVNVTAGDRIEIDGEPIPAIERTRLFLFHKPAGVVTTNRDPQGRRTVFDVLPQGLPRLVTVGRLDINTEGLLLLTNDGGLARVLELPQTGWLRRYRVRVHGEVDEAALAGLKEGIAVDGVFYGAIEAALDRRQGTNAWLTVGLREGKNREVKNVMAALGLEVTRLIRVSYGPFQLADLEEGQVRELRGRMLRDQLGPRLIEEAGADFDAPVATPFRGSDAAAQAPQVRTAEKDRPQRQAGGRPLREEEGGLIRNPRRDRTERRDDALSRLSTSAPSGEKRFGGKTRGDRPERRDEAPRKPRTANVWMAPGARPQPARKEGEEKVVKVARKPGDRKAKHDAAGRRYRPDRAERAAESAAEPPRREWKPRPAGGERPPGWAEREAAGETGQTVQRESGPRPKRNAKSRPQRPGADVAERRPYEKREGKPFEKRERRPRDGSASKSPSHRSRVEGKGDGQRGDFRKGRPSGKAGSRHSSASGPSPQEGGKPPRPRSSAGRSSGGPRKGPPKRGSPS